MKFQYPLQKIVDLKNSEKTEAEWMLSHAIGRLRDEEATLSELIRIKDELHEELEQTARSRTQVSELVAAQQYIEHLKQRIRDKNGDVVVAQHNVDLKHEKLVQKSIDEKVWSKAREKAYRQYVAQELRAEQQTLDELASMRRQAATHG